jgi:MoaA/NifB/PqqE/SkfB family radical SAM enzyme
MPELLATPPGIVRLGARRATALWRRVRGVPPPAPLIEYIAADLVNNCNLRCPFCLVDYSNTKRTDLMTDETFRKLLRLAPVVADGGFWLSCLHEPTLHPRLEQFIGLIPIELRHKFWFTTNLARKLPQSLIETLAGAGLHHVNISLDSFDEAVFAMLRKHGRLAVFRDNLDRLLEACARAANPLQIRYITMAFRSNLAEIPTLIRWMNQTGRAYEIEVRNTFDTWNIPEDFRRTQYLRPEEWEELRGWMDELSYTNCYLGTPSEEEAERAPRMPANWFDTYPGPFLDAVALEPPVQLRGRPDGRLLLSNRENVVVMNVNDHRSPLARLKRLVAEAHRARRKGHPVEVFRTAPPPVSGVSEAPGRSG